MSSYAQGFIGSVIQDAGQSVGQTLFDGFLKQLPGRQTQRGEFYMEHTRNLIENDFELMPPANKERIQEMFESVMHKREALEEEGGSRFRKARVFKRQSKELYAVAKKASDRGRNESVLSQMKQAVGTIESNVQDPFADQPAAAPTLTNAPVDSLNRAEQAAYEPETTGGRAGGLAVLKEDATAEELLAQIPSDALATDRVDCGVQPTTIIPLGEGQHPRDSAEVKGDRLGDSSDPTP